MSIIIMFVCSYLQDSELAHSFEEMAKNNNFSSKLLRLFDKILLIKYPNFNTTKKVTILEVLEWELWPTVIKIFGE